MCGRYSLAADAVMFSKYFNMDTEDLDYTPRYNIAPGQLAPVIVNSGGESRLSHIKWGLMPDWLKDRKGGRALINARAETLYQKPAFRRPFEHRRCLVPADGFYEWKKGNGSKTPMRIVLPDAPVFALAGIWDFCTDGRDVRKPSFCIITVAASKEMESIHPRMPAVLPDARSMNKWMDTGSPTDSLLDMLKPYEGGLIIYPVSPAVNSPLYEGPECIIEVPE